MGITREQYDFLTEGLRPNRVSKNPKGYSHLEAWDVRRHLIRTFGFGGFDTETKSLELVAQIESPPGTVKYSNGGTNNKTIWTVVYRAEVRLIIKDPAGETVAVYEDGAAGDAQNQPSLGDAHDQAMKTALSQALKRCAVNLGDQFGLGLYNEGRPDPVVHKSLVVPDGDANPSELKQVAAQDGPVAPDPQDALHGGEPVSPPAIDQPVDGPGASGDQAPSSAAPTRKSPSARAVQLFELLTTAEQVGELTAAWELVKAAVANGEITGDEGNQLKTHIGKRKAELAVPAALRAPSPADLKAVETPVPDMPMDGRRRSRLFALMAELGYTERGKQVEFLAKVADRPLASRGELTAAECEAAIGVLEGQKRQGGRTNGRPVGAAA